MEPEIPRDPNDIREDIAQANVLLRQYQQVAERNPDDESLHFSVRMLERRLQNLRLELSEAYRKHWVEQVELVLDGPEVTAGSISAWLLSDVLTAFQKMLHAFAQSILHKPTARGPLARDALDLSTLKVATTYAGSFGIILESITPPSFEEPVVSRALRVFTDLVGAGVDPKEVGERIRGLGIRPVARFRSLMEVCAIGQASLKICWHAPTGDGQVSVPSDYASQISLLLGTLSAAQQETVHLLGRLRGVNLNNRTFAFYDEANREHIYGKYEPTLEEAVKVALDKLCRATFLVTVQRANVVGHEKYKWTLTDLDL